MKYVEELFSGDIFTYNDSLFILTGDFKKNGSRLGIGLKDGYPTWFNGSDIVKPSQIYTLDSDNNIIPIQNVNNSSQNKNVPQVASVAHNGGAAEK